MVNTNCYILLLFLLYEEDEKSIRAEVYLISSIFVSRRMYDMCFARMNVNEEGNYLGICRE